MSKLQLLRVFGRVSDARRLYNYYVSFLEQYCVLFGNGHDPMVVTAYVHYCMCRHSLPAVCISCRISSKRRREGHHIQAYTVRLGHESFFHKFRDVLQISAQYTMARCVMLGRLL